MTTEITELRKLNAELVSVLESFPGFTADLDAGLDWISAKHTVLGNAINHTPENATKDKAA